MPKEVEAKYRVETFDAVREAIARQGGVRIGCVLQTDVLFDDDAGTLHREDRALRLRHARCLDPGGQDPPPLLTYKGPQTAHAGAKQRSESQTHVADAHALEEILAACGLRPSLTIQKRRESWRVGDVRIELDELPRIGRFVEIEAADASAIEPAAGLLGLEGEGITESYPALLGEHLRGLRRPASILFDDDTTADET